MLFTACELPVSGVCIVVHHALEALTHQIKVWGTETCEVFLMNHEIFKISIDAGLYNCRVICILIFR